MFLACQELAKLSPDRVLMDASKSVGPLRRRHAYYKSAQTDEPDKTRVPLPHINADSHHTERSVPPRS